jgi:hypothetical protein
MKTLRSSIVGMVNFGELEPGLENTLLQFDYAITSEPGPANLVSSYRDGLGFDVPLIAETLPLTLHRRLCPDLSSISNRRM